MCKTTLQFYGEADSILNQVYDRLVIFNRVPTIKRNMPILIDTGAGIPVWSTDTYLLQQYFPNAHPTNLESFLGGFGGEGCFVPTWEIPEFTLTSSDSHIIFHNLHVAIDNRFKSKFDLIMSLSMLRECEMTLKLGKVNDVPSVTLCYEHPEMWMNSKYVELVERTADGKTKTHNCLESEEIYTQEVLVREERSVFSLTNDKDLCDAIEELNYLPNVTFFVNLLGSYNTTLTNDEILNKVKERIGVKV